MGAPQIGSQTRISQIDSKIGCSRWASLDCLPHMAPAQIGSQKRDSQIDSEMGVPQVFSQMGHYSLVSRHGSPR